MNEPLDRYGKPLSAKDPKFIYWKQKRDRTLADLEALETELLMQTPLIADPVFSAFRSDTVD